MRVKTDGRRQAIIEAAIAAFREVGFERASMSMISRRLGGSKGTLYGYFESKEALFETAMKAAVEAPGDQIMDLLDPQREDLRGMLEQFGRAYLGFILGEEVLAITRTAVSEGADSQLGPHLFDQGPKRAIVRFTGFFAEMMRQNRLLQAEPLAVALHFKGLIEGGFLEEALYGAKPQRGIEEAVTSAVEAFLRAYSPRG